METRLKTVFVATVATAVFGWLPGGLATAQTFTNLHNFNFSDGRAPSAGLTLSGNILYGTAEQGGTSGSGTVFALNIDGTRFTNLYSFTKNSALTNSDGASPEAALLLSANMLYGTATAGGSGGDGTVFALTTNGTGFTVLHSFTAVTGPFPATNSDGSGPYGGLILSGNTLYGTTQFGGPSGQGTVFAVHIDATGFTNLHDFSATSGTFPNPYTNSDGGYPMGGLVLSGSTLYGTAYQGGSSGEGTVFAVQTDGTGFTTLHSFTLTDFGNPTAGLILSGQTLYGTAWGGGPSGLGSVFAIETDGTGFTNLYDFSGSSDGSLPQAGLILSGNTLYGTAFVGGGSKEGTVFAVHTDGTGFTTLHSFTARSGPFPATNSDGASPYGGLTLVGNTLYGTAQNGGTSGDGTIFGITLPPPRPSLAITLSGNQVILEWPTNAVGYALQSTTNLAAPEVWSVVVPEAVIVNGQNTVTNLVASAQQFYRLSQ